MKEMTSEELDSCGLYVDNTESTENYSRCERIGSDEGYNIEIFRRKNESSVSGPLYVVSATDGNYTDYVAADSLSEAIEVASKLSPLVTAYLLSQVVIFPRFSNYSGGVRAYSSVEVDMST